MTEPIATPARNSFMKIMSLVIANAHPKTEQKALIMIAHDNGMIDNSQVGSLMEWYGLRHIQ